MNWHNVLLRPRNLYEELLRRKLISGGGVPAVLQTVTGISPLTLLNVASKGIKSLTQFGKCEQASTPTPSVPVDIKCNNGTLKCRMASGLPVGYKKLSYIESTGTQYINTGFAIPDLTNEYEVEYKITISGGTGQGASSNNWGYMGQNGGLMLTLTGNHGVGAGSEGVPWVADHIYEISHHRGSDASRSVTVDGTVFQFGNQATAYADREFGIFSLSPFTTTFNRIYGKLYEFQAYKNGELVVSLIPCKRMSDNAIGVYDIVNDTFIGNPGTGAFIAGADDDETYIDVVGTPEVLSVEHIGQTDTYTAVDGRGTYVTPTTTVSTRIYKQLPLSAGRYTITVPAAYDFVVQYRKPADNTISPQDYGNYGSWTNGSETVTLDKADTYGYGISLRLHSSPTSNIDTTDFAGEIKIEHWTGQTASVGNLLGVGDYKDEQEIISGAVTRSCGIKVLDGTEEWTTDSYGGYRRMVLQEVLTASGDTLSVICSHYASRSSDARQQPNSIFIAGSGKTVIYVGNTQNITTVDEFNAWLAGQYANGTPVVIVYPLAEPTTEQVTAQHLKARDTATITAVTENISDITLEVEYWEKAE